MGTADGVAEYGRILDANAALGVTHIVYEPQNTLHATRFNATDSWGWEASLWFSMGERLREGLWDPRADAVPADVLEMVSTARAKGLGLLACVRGRRRAPVFFPPARPGYRCGAIDCAVGETCDLNRPTAGENCDFAG